MAKAEEKGQWTLEPADLEKIRKMKVKVL